MEHESMHGGQESSMHHAVHTKDEHHMDGMMPHMSKRPRKRMLRFILIGVIFIIVAGTLGYAAGGGKLWPKNQPKFYAVFLTNGQVFFGTIRHEDDENLLMDNVYYLQLVNPTTGTATDTAAQPTTKLVKKGDEPYGPQNSIRVNRQQVSVIEELRSDSQVLQQIQAEKTAAK